MQLGVIQRAFAGLHCDEKQARAMSSCIKNEYIFYGIKSEPRRAEQKRLLQTFGLPEQLAPLVRQMWEDEHREIQMFALDLLIMAKETKRKEAALFSSEMLTYLITTRSQWDTVDLLASDIVLHNTKLYPEKCDAMFDEWLKSDNVWLIRACVLHQTKAKDDLDEKLLFSLILRANDVSKDAWVQKAIGWALREYSLAQPAAVEAFVEKYRAGVKNPLPRLTVREARKHLDKKDVPAKKKEPQANKKNRKPGSNGARGRANNKKRRKRQE